MFKKEFILKMFLLIIILNYPLYYFENLKIAGITFAKYIEFLVILGTYLLALFYAKSKLNKVILISFFLIAFIIFKLFSYPEAIGAFLRKEYILFYYFLFYSIGYYFSVGDTYDYLLPFALRLFYIITIIGVIFVVLGIDFKLKEYSAAEGMFYHPVLGINRATSIVYNPQLYGMICVFTFILIKSKISKIISLIGLFFSFSRSSIISLISTFFLSKTTIRLKLFLLFSFVFLFIYSSLYVQSGILGRFFNIQNYLGDVRVLKFAIGVSFVFESVNSFLFGIPFDTVVGWKGVTFSDNTFIYLLLKGGFVFFILFLSILIRVYKDIRRSTKLQLLFVSSLVSAFFTISFAYLQFNILFLLIGSFTKKNNV